MTHPTSKSTGDLGVSDATVVTGQAIVTGVGIVVAAADISVIIYDNIAASGTVVFSHTMTFDDTTIEKSKYIKLPDVKCKIGMRVVITGVGASVFVHYR